MYMEDDSKLIERLEKVVIYKESRPNQKELKDFVSIMNTPEGYYLSVGTNGVVKISKDDALQLSNSQKLKIEYVPF